MLVLISYLCLYLYASLHLLLDLKFYSIFIFIFKSIFIFVFTSIFISICVCIFISMFVFVFVSMFVFIFVSTCICIFMFTLYLIFAYSCLHIHIYLFIQIYCLRHYPLHTYRIISPIYIYIYIYTYETNKDHKKISRHGGTASLRPVCLRTGTAYTILYKPYTAQIYCTTTFADYCFPFADRSRIFRGHITLHVKTVLYNPHTRTFRSMLIYIYSNT